MNKTRLLCLCFSALVLSLSSCSQDEVVAPNPNQGGENHGGGTPSAPDVKLKLHFDLTANIPHAEEAALRYEFAEKTSAIALIRSKAIQQVIYLPLTLTRSADQLACAGVRSVQVPLDSIKAQVGSKWQIKLLVGGKWDSEQKLLSFAGESEVVPSECRQSLVVNQPYISSWQDIPTDKNGQFVVSENGRTSISLSVAPRGVILSHHIVSCQAQAPVEIESLRMGNPSVSFSGSYDLSDSELLEGMDDTQHLEWKAVKNDTAVTFNFKKPLLIQNGEELKGSDYLYIWAGVPSESKEAQFTVKATGTVKSELNQAFSEQTIFAQPLPLEEGKLVEIHSSLHVEAPVPLEGPIELSTLDNKTRIKNDGIDKVEFVVKQNGVNVTASCVLNKQYNDIFDTTIKGNTFTSTTTGTYKFYAMKDGKKSNVISVSVYRENEVDENGNVVNGQLFCKNVSMASGWHDVNKVWHGDGLLCWAAASSNMLQWWLEDLQRKGVKIPERVPFGPGKTYSLKIFDVFVECWYDYTHSTDMGIGWFMKGGGEIWNNNNGLCAPKKKGYVEDGGYFKGVLSPEAEEKFFNSEFVVPYGAYSGWETENNVDLDAQTIRKKFSRLVTKLLNEGACSLTVDSHEITLWGCELVDGMVVRLYIANSDDNATKLTGYDIFESGGGIHLKGYPGKTNNPTRIIRLTGLKAYGN